MFENIPPQNEELLVFESDLHPPEGALRQNILLGNYFIGVLLNFN